MRQSCLERQPALVDLRNSKFQFIYNQEEVTKPDPDGALKTFWEYDYIEVTGSEEAIIIAALIHQRFSLDDEIALINNYNLGTQVGIIEYNTYQEYRSTIKELVKTTLQNDPLQ